MLHAHTDAAAPAGPASVLAGTTELRSAEELRDILGTPHPIVIDKVHDRLTEQDRGLLARSSFCALSTADAEGNCDVSPRGDVPGFTQILDAGTLALPDRPGNRRGDSLHNILVNPHVGLLYLIPGAREVIRVNGRARILTDAPFFDAMTVKGKRPDIAVVVEIDEIYLHCPQSLHRSGIWAPETWETAAKPAG
ncbi:MSMEG_1061 family FMN-dependent PPOX-type flavoprotein [Streptomyces sp. YIM 130001]|uniref:MSMEG_1061 family FMN-dependent PPOX-type flavoprotein n=1 Tax=Streptomyces sp. YIM 130001 TaxID=2259644 RepID=UPI001968E122|nr:MSMEG_1061 family FMN-dependent PPOX-type flavoprotein [Streptomyces sp. YIM 130001]